MWDEFIDNLMKDISSPHSLKTSHIPRASEKNPHINFCFSDSSSQILSNASGDSCESSLDQVLMKYLTPSYVSPQPSIHLQKKKLSTYGDNFVNLKKSWITTSHPCNTHHAKAKVECSIRSTKKTPRIHKMTSFGSLYFSSHRDHELKVTPYITNKPLSNNQYIHTLTIQKSKGYNGHLSQQSHLPVRFKIPDDSYRACDRSFADHVDEYLLLRRSDQYSRLINAS
jgi:hypothetical protein